MSVGSFVISEGNITRKKNKNPTGYAPNQNCQHRSSPDACFSHQRVGLDRDAWAAYSVLRVRTRAKCLEDNLRELT